MSEKDVGPYVIPAIKNQVLPIDQWKKGGSYSMEDIIGGPGSDNIGPLGHICKLSDEAHYHGGIKPETADTTIGYCRHPLGGQEVCAGNVYGMWQEVPMQATRMWLAEAGYYEAAADLAARTDAIMTCMALGAVPVGQRTGTPYPRPHDEWTSSPRTLAGWSTAYFGLGRAYVSRKDNNGGYKTDGRWNSIVNMEKQDFGSLLAWRLGEIPRTSIEGWTGEATRAMIARWGAGKPWAARNQALLRRLVLDPLGLTPAEWDTILAMLYWTDGSKQVAVPLNFLLFADGTRAVYAERSINNGSTNFCPFIIQHVDGYREWGGMAVPMRQQEAGVVHGATWDSTAKRIVATKLSGSYANFGHDEYASSKLTSPLLAHVRFSQSGAELVNGGSQPPIDPPLGKIDMVELMFPGAMQGKALTKADGTGYAYGYRDDEHRIACRIKSRKGTVWDWWCWDDDYVYHYCTEGRHEVTGAKGGPNFKIHEGENPLSEISGWIKWCRRFAEPGEELLGQSPHVTLYNDCERIWTRSLGQAGTRLTGPYAANQLGIGGDIPGSTVCYRIDWIWGAGGEHIESYWYAVGFGHVRYRYAESGAVVRENVRNLIIPATTTEPVFPCFDMVEYVKRVRDGGDPPPDPEPPPSDGTKSYKWFHRRARRWLDSDLDYIDITTKINDDWYRVDIRAWDWWAS